MLRKRIARKAAFECQHILLGCAEKSDEVMEKQQKWEILKTALLAVIAVLLLIRGNEPQQPKIELSSILPCDKQKCYDEASACAANPENKEDVSVDLTCLNPLNCKNISYGGETLFINEKQSKCKEEFEKCTKRCRSRVGM